MQLLVNSLNSKNQPQKMQLKTKYKKRESFVDSRSFYLSIHFPDRRIGFAQL